MRERAASDAYAVGTLCVLLTPALVYVAFGYEGLAAPYRAVDLAFGFANAWARDAVGPWGARAMQVSEVVAVCWFAFCILLPFGAADPGEGWKGILWLPLAVIVGGAAFLPYLVALSLWG